MTRFYARYTCGLVINVCVVLTVLMLERGNGDMVLGSLPLNSGVFDKVIAKYKAVLVKFDRVHPAGWEHEEFVRIAKELMSASTDLLLAEVNIQDFRPPDNIDLAVRFDVFRPQWPEYRLFVNGQSWEPISYIGDESKGRDIKRFIIKHTGLWLDLPSCLEDYDALVHKFLTTSSHDDRSKILKEAELIQEGEGLKQEEAVLNLERDVGDSVRRERADVYIKTFKKILDVGEQFIEDEIARVERLKEGKLSEKKKIQLDDKRNILRSFQLHQP